MSIRTRTTLRFGLAALVGLGVGAGSIRADEPADDIEASIRAFEAEQRAELDQGIEEVAAALAQQKSELEQVRAIVAKTEAALARLEAMKRALEGLDAPAPTAVSAVPVSVTEPEPIAGPIPVVPSRSLPATLVAKIAKVASLGGADGGSSCCAAASATTACPSGTEGTPSSAGWQPGAAVTRGEGVRVLHLPDGSLRVYYDHDVRAEDAAKASPMVREVSNTVSYLVNAAVTDVGPGPREEQSLLDDLARLTAHLHEVVERLDSYQSATVPQPPTPAVVRPSPSCAVPAP